MSTILLMNFHVACLPLSKPGEKKKRNVLKK